MLHLLEGGDAPLVPCLRMGEAGAGRDGEVPIRLRTLAKPRDESSIWSSDMAMESPFGRNPERSGSTFGGESLGNGRACE
jgi:hypothetical protein